MVTHGISGILILKGITKVMSLRVGWYSYALAIVSGLLITFFLSPLLQAEGAAWIRGLCVNGAVSAVLGLGLGVTFPDKSWLWGLWIVSPLWVLIIPSLLFAGTFYMFLVRDLPLLVVVTAAACGGAYLGARFIRRPRAGIT